MASPCLPIELWEQIIDTFVSDIGPPEDLKVIYKAVYNREIRPNLAALHACAATCKAWLPRSLVGLFRIVHLSNDDQTSSMIYGLITRSNLYALQIHHLILNTSYYVADKKGIRASALFPRIVSRLANNEDIACHQIITIHIYSHSQSSVTSYDIGPFNHYILLPSLASFRSLKSLALTYVTFDSTSYFVNLLLSLSTLRNLALFDVRVRNPGDHMAGPAEGVSLQFDSLRLSLFDSDFVKDVVQWINTFRPISRIDILYLGTPYDGAHQSLAQALITHAGKTLREFEASYSSELLWTFASNTNLETLSLGHFHTGTLTSVLSTIKSSRISRLRFRWISVFNIQEMGRLVDFLLSPQFASLSRLSRIDLVVFPADSLLKSDQFGGEEAFRDYFDVWHARLQSVFGDKIHMGLEQYSSKLASRMMLLDNHEGSSFGTGEGR